MKIVPKLLGLAVLLPTAGYGQVTLPKLGEVTIKEFSTIGDGCPKGSTTSVISSKKENSNAADAFQLVFSKFMAESGPGVKVGDRSNRCNITMLVEFPKGFRFRFKDLSFDGYANVAEGLTAEFETMQTRPGAAAVRSIQKIQGPFEGDIAFDTTGSGKDGLFSSCEGSSIMSVITMIRFKGPRDLKGLITQDRQSGSLSQNYEMEWELCED